MFFLKNNLEENRRLYFFDFVLHTKNVFFEKREKISGTVKKGELKMKIYTSPNQN